MSAKILTETSLEIDFSDCRVPTHDTIGICVDFVAVERNVREQLDAFGGELSVERRPMTTVSQGIRHSGAG